MSKYNLHVSSSFKRDFKKLQRKNDKDKVYKVIGTLLDGQTLEPKYQDHALTGEYSGYRECHVKPDLLLVYKVDDDILMLTILRIATHSKLF